MIERKTEFISMWAFVLYFICVEVAAEVDDIEAVLVMEGAVLHLRPGLEDLNRDVQILWTFESDRRRNRVAQMHQGKIYTDYDERFSGRVQLERETGVFTIADVRTNESGLCEALIIINRRISGRRYRVDVYARVSVPAIRSSSSLSLHQSTGTPQQMCSVKNDRGVSISWYKVGEIVTQTSNPDLNINLSLPLELHDDDPETYSCTAANPVSKKSVSLHSKHICPPQEDCQDHCGGTEALVRLVLSGLVGIATVFFLLEHVKICSSQGRASSA